jgi:hypothetical protein
MQKTRRRRGVKCAAIRGAGENRFCAVVIV